MEPPAQTTDPMTPGADKGREERPGKSSSRRRWACRVSVCGEPSVVRAAEPEPGRARAAPAPLLYCSLPPARPAAPAACRSGLRISEDPAPLGPAAALLECGCCCSLICPLLSYLFIPKHWIPKKLLCVLVPLAPRPLSNTFQSTQLNLTESNLRG